MHHRNAYPFHTARFEPRPVAISRAINDTARAGATNDTLAMVLYVMVAVAVPFALVYFGA